MHSPATNVTHAGIPLLTETVNTPITPEIVIPIPINIMAFPITLVYAFLSLYNGNHASH